MHMIPVFTKLVQNLHYNRRQRHRQNHAQNSQKQSKLYSQKRKGNVDSQSDDQSKEQLSLNPTPHFYFRPLPNAQNRDLIFFGYDRTDKIFYPTPHHRQIERNNHNRQERKYSAKNTDHKTKG